MSANNPFLMHPFCLENTSKWHLCLFGLAQPAAKPKNDKVFALSITSPFPRRPQRDAACGPTSGGEVDQI